MKIKYKRIAIIHPTMKNHGGAEFVVDKLATELVNLDCEVTLFTDKYDYDFWGKNKNYKIFTFNTGEQHLALKKWKKIGKMLSDKLDKFDLINPHNHPAYIYWYYAKSFNPKINASVIWYCEEPYRFFYGYYLGIIDTDIYKQKKITLIARFKLLIKRIAKHKNIFRELIGYYYFKLYIRKSIKIDKIAVNELNKILCNSDFTLSNVIKCFNRDAYSCPLGLMSEIKPVKPEYNQFFFTISRIENIKNIFNIVKSVENLFKANKLKGYKYIIAGKGPDFDEINKYIYKNDLKNIIEMKGFITEDEKNDLYLNCAFTISLPLDEPFGLFCLESFAFKKCLITSNHGGPAEITKDKETGILVDPFKINEIENAILYLIKNPLESKKMGENGYKDLLSKYTFKHFINRFIYMINDISPRKYICG